MQVFFVRRRLKLGTAIISLYYVSLLVGECTTGTPASFPSPPMLSVITTWLLKDANIATQMKRTHEYPRWVSCINLENSTRTEEVYTSRLDRRSSREKRPKVTVSSCVTAPVDVPKNDLLRCDIAPFYA